MTSGAPVDPAELRGVRALADLDGDDLAWVAAASEVVTVEPGEPLFSAGDPASWMYLFLDGTLHARREQLGAEAPVFRMSAGDVSGMLPFSRMTEFTGTGRAVTRVRVARFPAARFGELLRRVPALEQRLVAVMADRVRRTTQDVEQTEKLVALGRLSAGLAHELNNPAAAVSRAAAALRVRLAAIEGFTAALAIACASPDAVATLDAARRAAVGATARNAAADRLFLRASDLALPFRTYNAELATMLDNALAAVIEQNARASSLSQQVQWLMRRALTGGRPEIRSVARELALSERSLQRRLQEEGRSFQALLSDTRHQLAREYLINRSLEITEIAYMLGYDDQASFYRAFQRWENQTPTQWRDRQAQHGAPMSD